MLQLSSSTNKSQTKRKKGLKFSVHFVVLKIHEYVLKATLKQQKYNGEFAQTAHQKEDQLHEHLLLISTQYIDNTKKGKFPATFPFLPKQSNALVTPYESF